MIEANVRKKIAMLGERAQRLVRTPQGLRNEEWVASAAIWLAEAENVAALAVSDYLNPYRKHISLALGYGSSEKRLRKTASMLEALVTDSVGGLLTGLAIRFVPRPLITSSTMPWSTGRKSTRTKRA